jgi:hypothetical protein
MKPQLTCLATVLAAALVAASVARPAHAASSSAEQTARLLAQMEPRIKAIYETNEFAVRSFTATWLPDGSGYLRLETPAGASAAEVVLYDAPSGKLTVVVPRGETRPTWWLAAAEAVVVAACDVGQAVLVARESHPRQTQERALAV